MQLTFILSFGFLLGLFVDLLREFAPNVTEVWHGDTSLLEPSLGLLQLVIRELQLTNEVTDSTGKTATSKQVTAKITQSERAPVKFLGCRTSVHECSR